jgi:hypothetical protein
VAVEVALEETVSPFSLKETVRVSVTFGFETLGVVTLVVELLLVY